MLGFKISLLNLMPCSYRSFCHNSVTTQNAWLFRRKFWRFWSAMIFYERNDDATAVQRRVLRTALWCHTF